MAVWAIGDIQGCAQSFDALLEQIAFNAQSDQLWIAGDLVNRGPDSAGVLRRIISLGTAARCILGNHDLSLLALDQGFIQPHRKDTFNSVLDAPDRQHLIAFLRQQPLVQYCATLDTLMVHAGILPVWDVVTAQALSDEINDVLGSDLYLPFLEHMFGNTPNQWHDQLVGIERWRCIVNIMTRMRLLSSEQKIDFKYKDNPKKAPAKLAPWFSYPRQSTTRIIYGHWASLGYHEYANTICLDTGCVWGNSLTALRLDQPDSTPISVPFQG